MEAQEMNYFYWPIVIQSIFDWTINLNEDFAKGRHTVYQTTSAAVLLVLGTQYDTLF